VGFDIQPPSDTIDLYGDDSTVLFVSYTVEHDSVVTTNLPTLILGSINDPVFGSTQAAFNTQFRLSHTNHFFGEDATLDSICLQLGYSGRWGDSTTWMRAYVYKLTDSLYLNSDTSAGNIRNNYYATDVIEFNPKHIGAKYFLDQPFDSVDLKRFWVNRSRGMHAPFLSIRLDDDFGKALLADSASFVSNADFLKKFHGLRVAVDPVVGSFGKMVYFSPESPETKMVLYYTYFNTSTNTYADSSYTFVIDRDRSLRFNEYKVEHLTACSDLRTQLNSTSPISGNQRLYLQPFSGVRIKVNFDGIEKLRGKKIVINEAKLYLNNAEPYNKDLLPAQQLAVYTVNASGRTVLTPDAELGMTYMGGKFNSEKNRYETRITRYLQKRILDPSMDNDNLYISISGASYYANRVVLFGNNPDDESDKKAKIGILYSEY
jgi:hypothetical protein